MTLTALQKELGITYKPARRLRELVDDIWNYGDYFREAVESRNTTKTMHFFEKMIEYCVKKRS